MNRSDQAGAKWGQPRLLDWWFYLAARRWRTVVLDEALPAALCQAVRGAAENVVWCRDVVGATGRGPRPAAPVDLAVLTACDSCGSLKRSGHIGPATVTVVFGRSQRRRPGRSCATCEDVQDRGHRTTLVIRAVAGSRTAVYYPAEDAAARRYVWRVLYPPMSLKARLARVGVDHTAGSLVCRVRERNIALSGPRGFLVSGADQLLLISSGLVATNPVIAVEVPVGQRGCTPTRVFKIPREAAFRAMLDREQSKLTRLQRIMPDTPVRPLGTLPWGDTGRGWAQTAVEGVRLDTIRWSRRLPFVRHLAEWLSDLESSVAKQISLGTVHPPEVGPWCRTLAISAQSAFKLDPVEREYLLQLPHRMAAADLRLTFAHRDAGPWNIICSRDRAVLIDWESAGWGLPGEDLVYLLLHLFIERLAPSDRTELPRLFTGQFMDPRSRPVWLHDLLRPLERSLSRYDGAFRDVVTTILLSHALRVHHLARSSRGKMALDQPFLALWREAVLQDE